MPGRTEKDLRYPNMRTFPKIDGFDSEGMNALLIMLRRMEAGKALAIQRKKPSLVLDVEEGTAVAARGYPHHLQQQQQQQQQQHEMDYNDATIISWSSYETMRDNGRKRSYHNQGQRTSNNKNKRSNVPPGGYCDDVERTSVCYRKDLPKYILENDDDDDDDDDHDRPNHHQKPLFSRAEFQTGVLHDWEEEVKKLCPCPQCRWRARLRDTYTINSNVYALEVTGPKVLLDLPGQKQLLDSLRRKTGEWVQSRLHLYNANKVLSDGESLLFDIMVAPGESLGASKALILSSGIDKKRYHPQDAVWMTQSSTQPDDEIGGLAKALGSAKPFEAGFAIVAINDERCTSAEMLKAWEEKSSQGSKMTKVSVCLSKYANLEELDLSKGPQPRRQDREPFDLAYYVALKADNDNKKQPPSTSGSSVNTNTATSAEENDETTTQAQSDSPPSKRNLTSTDDTSLSKLSKRPRINDDSDDDNENGDDNEDDDGDHIIVIDDDDVGDVIESAEENTHHDPEAPTGKLANFNRFKAKYIPFVTAEYSGSGIPNLTSISSMWRIHKEIYGDDHLCDDDCKCYGPDVLFRLTKTVIKDYIKKQEKKGIHVSSKLATAGIDRFFGPKFFPKLEKEYPELPPKELIQRLVDMWDLHKWQKLYGLQCNKQCDCEEGWEALFCEGNIQMAKEKFSAPPSAKRRKSGSHSRSYSIGSTSLGSPTTPNRNPHMQKMYEISFDTHAPLGAYFITERGKCKVHSIYSRGQFKKDARLSPGTIVDSAMIGSVRNRISNHDDLMEMYNIADQKPTKKLRLVFINTEVLPSAAIPVLVNKDWTSTGLWQGRLNHGWSGAAGTRGHEMKSMSSPSRFEKFGFASHQPLQRANSFTTTSSRNVSPQHSAARTNCAGWASTGLKKVKFNIERSHGPSETPEHALCTSVKHKTYKNLISALEAGCACTADIAFFKLHELYDEVKTDLRSVKHGLYRNPSDSLLQSAKNDILSKKRILNMYKSFCSSIEDAVSLEHRACFEIKIREFSIWKPSNVHIHGRSHFLGVDVKIRVHHANGIEEEMMLGAVPPHRYAECVQLKEDGKDNVFIAVNCCGHQLESRDLVIEIFEGLKTDKVYPLLVSSFTVPLNQIEETCPKDGSTREFCSKACRAPSDPSLSTGEIKLDIRKCKTDSSQKKNKIKTEILRNLNFINMFNEEHQSEGSPVALSTNVQGCQNVSLLHVAVLLCDDDLIEILLQGGANPHGRSKLGSPIFLAAKLKDKADEKLKNEQFLSKRRGVSLDVTASCTQEFVIDSFNRILTLLRESDNMPCVPQKFYYKEIELDDKCNQATRSEEVTSQSPDAGRNIMDDNEHDNSAGFDDFSHSDSTEGHDGGNGVPSRRQSWGRSPSCGTANSAGNQVSSTRQSWGKPPSSSASDPTASESNGVSPTRQSWGSASNSGTGNPAVLEGNGVSSTRQSWAKPPSLSAANPTGSECNGVSSPRQSWGRPSNSGAANPAVSEGNNVSSTRQSWGRPSNSGATNPAVSEGNDVSSARQSWGRPPSSTSTGNPTALECNGVSSTRQSWGKPSNSGAANPAVSSGNSVSSTRQSWGRPSNSGATNPAVSEGNDVSSARQSWGRPPSSTSTGNPTTSECNGVSSTRQSWSKPSNSGVGNPAVSSGNSVSSTRQSWGRPSNSGATNPAVSEGNDVSSTRQSWGKPPSSSAANPTASESNGVSSTRQPWGKPSNPGAANPTASESNGVSSTRHSWGRSPSSSPGNPTSAEGNVTSSTRQSWGKPSNSGASNPASSEGNVVSSTRPGWGQPPSSSAANPNASESNGVPSIRQSWGRSPSSISTANPPASECNGVSSPRQSWGRPSNSGAANPAVSEGNNVSSTRQSWGRPSNSGATNPAVSEGNNVSCTRQSWGKPTSLSPANPTALECNGVSSTRQSWGKPSNSGAANRAVSDGNGVSSTRQSWGKSPSSTSTANPTSLEGNSVSSTRPSWGKSPSSSAANSTAFESKNVSSTRQSWGRPSNSGDANRAVSDGNGVSSTHQSWGRPPSSTSTGNPTSSESNSVSSTQQSWGKPSNCGPGNPAVLEDNDPPSTRKAGGRSQSSSAPRQSWGRPPSLSAANPTSSGANSLSPTLQSWGKSPGSTPANPTASECNVLPPTRQAWGRLTSSSSANLTFPEGNGVSSSRQACVSRSPSPCDVNPSASKYNGVSSTRQADNRSPNSSDANLTASKVDVVSSSRLACDSRSPSSSAASNLTASEGNDVSPTRQESRPIKSLSFSAAIAASPTVSEVNNVALSQQVCGNQPPISNAANPTLSAVNTVSSSKQPLERTPSSSAATSTDHSNSLSSEPPDRDSQADSCALM